jgi:hypothetical protein
MAKRDDLERRLFEFSLGELRLLDTVLDKAGQRKLADLLRDLLLDWRAYPSRTKYAPKDLRNYATTLGKVAAGLRKAGQSGAANHAAQIKLEIEEWTRRI